MTWEVSERKVRSYLLDVTHCDDGPKARFFLARGFSDAQRQRFRQALSDHPVHNPVAAEQQTPFGSKLIVRCRIETPDGANPCIRTAWMVEPGGQPRLVMAYPSG